MTVKQGYKLTEVGVIPEDWEVKELQDLVNFLDGKRKPIKSNERMSGDYPYYGASGIIDYVKNYIFDGTFILLGEDGENILSRNLPLAFIAKGKIWVNNHAHVLLPRENINIKFLSEFLENLDYSFLNSGTAQPKLNKQNCETIKVCLPPTLPEQTAIANALSNADAYINSLEQLIAKKQLIKQGTMQQLLTGKKRLEGFSGEWAEMALCKICDFINGRAYNLSEWESKGTPVIRLQNLTGRGDNFYYSNLKLPEKQYCLKGDLLFMWSATFGIVVWQGEKAIYHYHIWKVVPITWAVEKSFLFYILDELTEKLKKSSSNGGTMLHITKEKMEATEVFIPSDIEEQTAIANILTNMDNDIQALQNKLTKAKHIKQGMMQELLTGKTRLVQPH